MIFHAPGHLLQSRLPSSGSDRLAGPKLSGSFFTHCKKIVRVPRIIESYPNFSSWLSIYSKFVSHPLMSSAYLVVAQGNNPRVGVHMPRGFCRCSECFNVHLIIRLLIFRSHNIVLHVFAARQGNGKLTTSTNIDGPVCI